MEPRRGFIFDGCLLSQSDYDFSKRLPSLRHPTIVEMGRLKCIYYCGCTRFDGLDPSSLRRKALHPQHWPDKHLRDDMFHSDLPIYLHYASIYPIIYGLDIGRFLIWYRTRSGLRIIQLAQIWSKCYGSSYWKHPRSLSLHSLLQPTSWHHERIEAWHESKRNYCWVSHRNVATRKPAVDPMHRSVRFVDTDCVLGALWVCCHLFLLFRWLIPCCSRYQLGRRRFPKRVHDIRQLLSEREDVPITDAFLLPVGDRFDDCVLHSKTARTSCWQHGRIRL